MKTIKPRLLAGLLALATSIASAAQTEDYLPQKLKEKVAAHYPYRIGDELEARVQIGQALQIDCAENSYWVKEYLVYPSQDRLCVIPIDADGCLMRGINHESLRRKAMTQELPDSPCLAILRWEIQDQTLTLHFCVSTNLERNLREFELMRPRSTNAASLRPDSKVFPPLKLPEDERLAGFVRLWSDVKYNFVSFDHVPEVDWDKVLVEYLPKVKQADTPGDYFCVLAQCLALLRDGHTDVSYGNRKPYRGYGRYELPMKVQLLADGRAVIVETVPVECIFGQARKEEFLKANLKPGEEVAQIDGRPVNTILEQDIYPCICASTPQSRDRRAAGLLLLGSYGSKATLRIRGFDGTDREVSLTRKHFIYNADYSVRGTAVNKFECRELEGGLVYVNLPGFSSKDVVRQFRDAMPQVLKSKGLILDVRKNDGGSSANANAIISLLIDKSIPADRWKTRKYVPAFRAWGRKEQWHEGGDDKIFPTPDTPFLGPVAVLTGPATFSAAEDFVAPLHASKRARVVGERTGGSTGQPLQIELPFGGHARVCTKRDTYPDGREFVGIGIIPDVEIHPAPADIAAGRDVVLEGAVRILGN